MMVYLIDYVVVNRRLAGLMQDNRGYRSVIIDLKVKISMSQFRNDDYIPGSFDVSRLQDRNLREIFQE